jgi:NAD-dependent DNA ligase
MITELIEKIESANIAYRLGKPIMSDSQYDILVDELKQLDPHNPILTKVGHAIIDESRKRRLPIEMASMNKVKTIDEIIDWCRLKGINTNQTVVITPKYDGLSLCVNELTDEAWTRGDGEFGQKSDEHYKLIKNHLEKLPNPWPNAGGFKFTYGEVMMPKKVFVDKYSNDYANPRNLVAGLLNSKDINEFLKDTVYIKYGGVLEDEFQGSFNTKSDLLKSLNDGQDIKVPFEVMPIKNITHEILFDLFKSWSQDFEIDGLIIEIDFLQTQEVLGRETSSNNPCWARAYKSPDFEQVAETTIIGISWNISKQGYLKPTLHVSPIKLDGVTISNVTGNNARFVKDMGLGIGAKVLIKRSGMVIPVIYDVIEKVDFVIPNIPNIDWSDSGVELITLSETDEQRFKQAVSFFKILEVDNVGEGVVKQLWDAGFNSIQSILELTPDKLSKLDGFGKRKSMIVYNSIQSKIKNIQLSKLQHATGLFKGLGSKKLALLEHFTSKPTLEEVSSIEGFAETLAKSYLESYDKFFDFLNQIPVTIAKKVEVEKESNDLDGKSFVFTGIRVPKYEEFITENGGKVSSTVSKNTTYLVMKSKGSGSSKEKKAIDLGVKILEIKDLEDIIYTIKNK